MLAKTQEQIEGIRKSCRLASATLKHLESFIVPGVTTAFLDQKASEFISNHGAVSATLNYPHPQQKLPFPASICTSVNDVICHGVPNEQVLEEGNIVGIDVAIELNGYFGDLCKTYPVGQISKKAKRLLEIAKHCLDVGIAQVKPGNYMGNIGYFISSYAQNLGYSVVTEFGGHTMGLQLHEGLHIPHMAAKNSGPKLQPGITFTIEPMICIGKPDVVIDESDTWTARTADRGLCAQFEHSLVVTETGVEVLTYH
jgi:methionyl aminopeptidase